MTGLLRLNLGRVLLSMLATVALAAPASAGAVTLQPGDVVIADSNSQGDSSGAIVLVDPLTGQQTLVSSNAINAGGDLFVDPLGVALDAQGRLLVADPTSSGGTGAVIRVDPASGQQTLISSNAINTGTDLFLEPSAVVVDDSGQIFVADADAAGGDGAVIRVDPDSGQQTAVSDNTINTGTDLFQDPFDLTFDAQGQILLVDASSQGVGQTGAVIRVDPATGQQTAVSNSTINSGTDLFGVPLGIGLEQGGRILVADLSSQGVGNTGAVIGVDPVTGQQTLVSNNTVNAGTDLFDDPTDAAVDAAGRILVTDRDATNALGALIGIDGGGQQTAISDNTINTGTDLFSQPSRFIVVPPSTAIAKCRGLGATIVGDAAANVISGTPANDVIVGLGGNDVIRSLGGKDVVCGGAGKDRAVGGAGRDTLLGQAGGDTLKGGPGRDKLLGGPGRDRLIGGPGLDRLRGGPGRDRQRQ